MESISGSMSKLRPGPALSADMEETIAELARLRCCDCECFAAPDHAASSTGLGLGLSLGLGGPAVEHLHVFHTLAESVVHACRMAARARVGDRDWFAAGAAARSQRERETELSAPLSLSRSASSHHSDYLEPAAAAAAAAAAASASAGPATATAASSPRTPHGGHEALPARARVASLACGTIGYMAPEMGLGGGTVIGGAMAR
jgi:hypothetical protein